MFCICIESVRMAVPMVVFVVGTVLAFDGTVLAIVRLTEHLGTPLVDVMLLGHMFYTEQKYKRPM